MKFAGIFLLASFYGCNERSSTSPAYRKLGNFALNGTQDSGSVNRTTSRPTMTDLGANTTTSSPTRRLSGAKTSTAPVSTSTVSSSASSSMSSTAEPSTVSTTDAPTTAVPTVAVVTPAPLPLRPAPASQPDTARRFVQDGNFYERFFLEGEGDVDAIVVPNVAPGDADLVPRNTIGQWVMSINARWESVAQTLADFMSDENSRETAEADYMEFWAASRGEHFLQQAALNCGQLVYSNNGLNCYNLMMLATNVPVPVDRKPRHVARDIGLEQFCIDNEAALVRELTNRNIVVEGRFINPDANLVDRYMESFTGGYSANWLSFCPNLIDASTKEIRQMVFNHGVFRAKVFAASRRDRAGDLRVTRETLFGDAVGDFLSYRNIGNLLQPVNSVVFDQALEIGVGQGVITNWYNEMSGQIFGDSAGLFEYVNSNRYVRLKSGILAQAGADGTERAVKAKLRAAGRFFGHVIANGRKLSADLTTMFYARLVGKFIGFEAIRDYEPQIYRYFADAHAAGDYTLLPIPVQARVAEYADWPEPVPDQEYLLDRAASDYVTYNVGDEFSELVGGLFEVIPQSVFESGIKTTEMRELLFGALEVDVEDMFRNWELDGFRETDREIRWLKEILTEFSQEDRRRFVGFVTGSTQVPAGGFRMYPLVGVRYRFNIQRYGQLDRIPTAGNCFNRLKFHSFSSKETMRRLILVGLDNGAGFGLV